MRKMDKILLFLAAFLVIFIVCMVIVFCKYQAIPDTLVGGVLTVGLGELFACMKIKLNDNATESEDEEEWTQ